MCPNMATYVYVFHCYNIVKSSLNSQHHTETVFKDYRVENVDEILNLMRLACARNLARALIIENAMPVA